MKASTLLIYRKMFFIVQSLLSYHRLSQKEINALWLASAQTDNQPFDRNVFYNYLDNIQSAFNIIIGKGHEGREYFYYIVNPQDLGSAKLYNWSISSLAIGDLLLHHRNLHDRILLSEIPSENGRLLPILEAMHMGCVLRLKYRKYQSPDAKERLVEPYCIRQYNSRLYLLGYEQGDRMKSFPLERIEELHITDEKFEMTKDFDAHEYYKYTFGIYVDEEKYPPRRLVIRATANEACYLKDTPIHHSQKIIAETERYTDFEYFMALNEELKGFIVSRIDRMKVLEPQVLADQIREIHLRSAYVEM